MTTETPIALTSFVPLVHADLPKCPSAILNQKILEAVRDFCRETKAYRLELDPITIQANLTEYVLNGWDPDEADMNDVLAAKRSNGDLDAGVDYTVPETGLFKLLYTPGAREANALVVTISLIPTPTATTIDADLFRQYSDVIADGIRYMAMAMPGKPWTNGQAGSFFFTRYEAAKSNAKGRVWRGRTARPMVLRPKVSIV